MKVQLEPGVPVVQPVPAPSTPKNVWAAERRDVVWPPGIAPKPNWLNVQRLEGTPTQAGVYEYRLVENDRYGSPTGHTETLTITVGQAVITIPVPAAQGTEAGYTLPEVEGVRWLVDGVPTVAGSYSVQPVAKTTTVRIVAEALDGYRFDSPATPLVLTFHPGDETTWKALLDDDPQALYVATRLADRIIRHVDQRVDDPDPAEALTARDHAMVVLEYVKGYTRDRGFEGYIPHRSLQAVIVSAAARLFTNPEQVTYYSTGDYSERPATMTGWTAAELGVLRRYRRTYQ